MWEKTALPKARRYCERGREEIFLCEPADTNSPMRLPYPKPHNTIFWVEMVGGITKKMVFWTKKVEKPALHTPIHPYAKKIRLLLKGEAWLFIH